MIRSKQILFYGIMVVMTLLAIEGMAQAAYYIAYGEFNGAGPAPPPSAGTDTDTGTGTDTAADTAAADYDERFQGGIYRISHPFYGYTRVEDWHPMNQVPPPRREEGVVLIALQGGSVALGVAGAFRDALTAWFQDNDIPLRPVVIELAHSGMKQPQQVMQIANTLALGGEYDIIVNLDGYNELILTRRNHFLDGISPFFPLGWDYLQDELTDAQQQLVSRSYGLRQREQRLAAGAAAAPWRWSALYGLVNRYLLERAAAQIRSLNRELAAAPAEHDLELHGPAWPVEPDDLAPPDPHDLARIALRVWYRSSVLLDSMSRDAGAEYYHFLQPNQYVPGSKPLTDAERAVAYTPTTPSASAYPQAYPLWRRLGAELRQRGVNYHDLTQIFVANRETLYIDNCCHFNARGNALLAASMVQRLAPALRDRAARAGAGSVAPASAPARTRTALEVAARERTPASSVNNLYFDVRLIPGRALRYSRAGCRPADTAAPFVVEVTPVDRADLPPERAEYGFNRYEFSFDQAGGVTDAAGRCGVEYQLPDYEIAGVRTGQYDPATGQLLGPARITLDTSFLHIHFEASLTAAGALRYSKSNCWHDNAGINFFLHIWPVDAANLSPGSAEHGFNNHDFAGFSPDEWVSDAAGHCHVERALPEYDIARITTGQYVPAVGHRLWETSIDVAPALPQPARSE